MNINIITADEIVDKNEISFKFIFDSQSDYQNHQKVGNWGLIKKFDEECYLINIFKSGSGLVIGWGTDNFNEDWMKELLEKMPPASLLMEKELAVPLKEYLEKNSIPYAYHHFEGTLSTS